jgi:3-hydroxyacyl-[acyl-carrier-protein] dehydratase
MELVIAEKLNRVPHIKPYRFIESISEVSDSHIIGSCFLDADSFFYKGHFPKNPITPGYIITEVMAQTGILGLGLYLVKNNIEGIKHAFLTSTDVKFHSVSYPNDTITINSQKIYFRFSKLKCYIKAFNQNGKLLCSGYFSGIIKSSIQKFSATNYKK